MVAMDRAGRPILKGFSNDLREGFEAVSIGLPRIPASVAKMFMLDEERDCMAVEGFSLKGREDYSDILIEHSDWSGMSWRLMIPEYGWVSKAERSRKVEWPQRTGRRVSWRWADEEAKREAGNELWGNAAVLGPGEIEYSLTFRNIGASKWGAGQSSLICLISGEVPLFHDCEGQRTFVWRCGEGFVDIDTVQGGVWAPHRMWGGRVPAFASPQGPAFERLMVKESTDGYHALGIATEPAIGVSCNHQPRMSCIHSNPLWGSLAPGEEGTVRGKIYLLRGRAEDVFARYRRDFGLVCPGQRRSRDVRVV